MFPLGSKSVVGYRVLDYIGDVPDRPKRSDIDDYVRLLENPYASLQVGDPSGDDVLAPVSATPFTSKRLVDNVHRQADLFVAAPSSTLAAVPSGNPNARLANLEEEAASGPVRNRSEEGVSKAAFEAECRSIFRKYIPDVERGTLRQEHRDFISRNRARAAGMRLKILEALRRYDLTDLGAMQPQFNREDSRLTVKKLLEIERSVVKDE
jgi:hypothetical protein